MSIKCSKSKNKDKLERQGWIRQFIADEPRLSEAVELYKSLGYEVRLQPITREEMNDECKKCLLYQNRDKYKIIYIRSKRKGAEKRESVDAAR